MERRTVHRCNVFYMWIRYKRLAYKVLGGRTLGKYKETFIKFKIWKTLILNKNVKYF